MEKDKIERSNKRWLVFWGVIFAVIVVIVVCVLSSLQWTERGATTVVKITSLSCEADNVSYPLFAYDESDKKELRIITTYNDEELRSISLQYKMFYSDEEKNIKSEADNHARMNILYGEDGLNADEFSSTYAVMNGYLKFSMYALRDEIINSGEKYFMLDGIPDYKINTIGQKYAKLGMKCTNS